MENNKTTYERPERKIGEIFEHNGEWYQCVEYDGCDECSLRTTECGSGTKSDLAYEMFGHCSKATRSDNKHTIFKKLEKVGEPVIGKGRIFQRLIGFGVSCEGCIFNTKNNPCDKYHYVEGPCPDREIWVEIKQNEKDMEEKKLNLKPFDIQKAREGKSICTRDGRNARIICFDAKDTQPIIGLYEKDIDGIVREYLCSYHMDGRMYDDHDCGYDLMMLPEKKEGWVNVYKDSVYDTKDEALMGRSDCRGYIDTINVSWEE